YSTGVGNDGELVVLKVADVDGDGHPDVLVAGITGLGGVLLLPGKGDGTFGAPLTFAVGNNVIDSIVLADLNGDCTPDLVVSHDRSLNNQITVLPNNPVPPGGCQKTDTFTYTANDGPLDSNVATVSIAIHPPNHPPLITSTPVTTAFVGQVYEYLVTSTDPDEGDTPTFSLPTAPAGMTIDAASGLIRWKPTSAQAGKQNVIVRVQDHGGLGAEQHFTVAVVRPVTVPNVVGRSQAAAQAALTGAGLTVGAITNTPRPTVPAGRVLGQSPVAGAIVPQGTAVNLLVSRGPPGPGDILAAVIVEPANPLILVGQQQACTPTGVLP